MGLKNRAAATFIRREFAVSRKRESLGKNMASHIDEPRAIHEKEYQKTPNAKLHSAFFGTPDGNRTHN